METLLSLLVGIGLSAACGFRVFVPLLVMSIAHHSGHLTLAPGFSWIGSDVALVALIAATLLEVGAYYIPWLDNLLDTVATPAAIIAGTVVTASMVQGMSPFLQWTLGVIAGGGAAAVVQGTTVVARGASGVATGGLGNPLIATIELGGSILGSVMAIWVPVLALLIMLLMVILFWKKIVPWVKSKFSRQSPTSVPPRISTN